MTDLRDAVGSDFKGIVKLNEAEVRHTSLMDLDRLQFLARISAYFKVAIVENELAAFLIALREDTAYENDNYTWFSSRFAKFLYIDRIVVGATFSGHKIGSKLYTDIFDFARSHSVKTIACEYNIDPPNPVSQAFHDKFGFRELSTQWVASGTKKVSLQTAEISKKMERE
jgi:uncharacterized protein